ncbi:MAG: ABC transporter permease, partial [Chloroflexi bacterium]|nr:ABC transporter permease [Chloroflexota bacterium]
MLAKTSGAILFGIFNALVPIIMASFIIDLSGINWFLILPAVILIAAASTFLGLFIAVSVSEVFEAQTFSNFFRFPMIFLCGLFFPIAMLPGFLQPISYALPLTYGADILHGAFGMGNSLAIGLDFLALAAFCVFLFVISLRNVYRKWIV